MEADNFETGAPNTKEQCSLNKYSVFSNNLMTQVAIKSTSEVVPTSIHDALLYFKYSGKQIPICCVLTDLNVVWWSFPCNIKTTTIVEKTIQWYCDNVLMQLINSENLFIEDTTAKVKLRIAISMINKLENNGLITKEENIYITNNMIRGLEDLFNDLLDDSLPF